MSEPLSTTMSKIDSLVREMHEQREGHPAQGHWTERSVNGSTMTPRKFVPTCCDKR